MNTVSSLQGFRVRTQWQVGYRNFDRDLRDAHPYTKQELCNNQCLDERDARSWNCGWAGWPQDDPANMCYGNNNGKELDRCMSTCWSPEEMKLERPAGLGGPYESAFGDKCFNEFLERANEGMPIPENKNNWNNCMESFK